MAESRSVVWGLQLAATCGWGIVALAVFWWGRSTSLGRAFCRFALFVVGWNLGIALKLIPEVPGGFLQLAFYPLFLIPAAGLETSMALVGCLEDRRVAMLVRCAYWVSGILCVLQTHQLVFASHDAYGWGFFGSAGPVLPALILHMLACIACGLWVSFTAVKQAEDERLRSGINSWILGISLFSVMGFGNFLPNYGYDVLPMGAIGSLILLVILLSSAWKSRSDAFDREMVRLAPVFGQVAVVAGPFYLVFLVALVFEIGGWLLPFVAALATGVIILVYYEHRELRSETQRVIEEILFPDRYRARNRLRELAADPVLGPGDVTKRLRETLEATCETLGVVGVSLQGEGDDGQGSALSVSVGKESEHFEPDSSTSGTTEPGKIRRVDKKALAVPVPGGQGSRGLLVVGPRRSGAAFSDADVTLLAMVAAQVGLALDLADARESLAEREAELADQALELASLRRRLDDEAAAIRAEVRINPKFADIIGENPRLVAALHAVEQAAAADIPVLVTGETGTGKELIANAVHALSRRSSGPLIAVNCPAIPVELAEAELFGHERGAFTGATEARPGRFENANHGTLFLDEVADLPMGVQTKLLRVLQEQESQRLGSDRVHKLDFRIVAATNRDLDAEVARGRFREDLLHRLAGVHIVVPPLRERRSDIPTLATFFLERAAHELGKEIEGLSAEALEVLVGYPWPGNIRELQNVIDRAVLLCPKSVIQPEHLGELRCDDRLPDSHLGNGSLTDVLRDEKIRRVESALVRSGGNQAAAARSLGMSRSNLSRMMKRYGIKARRGAGAADTDGADAGDSAE